MIHPNHSRRSAGLLLLIGFLFVAAQASMAQPSQGVPATGTPTRAASAAQPSRHTTPATNAADGPPLTGVLSVIWGDGQDGSSTTAYYLTTDGGRMRELLVSPGAAADLWRLNGRRVVVQPAGGGDARRDDAPRDPAGPLPVASVVAVGDDRTADAPAADPVAGTLPYLSLLCAFPDGEEAFKPAAFYRNMYGNTAPRLGHYWDDLSYGAVSLAGSDAAGPFTLPRPKAAYGVPDGAIDLGLMAQDCVAAADPTVDFDDFHGVNLMFNNITGCCAWGGAMSYEPLEGGARTLPTTWLPPWAWRDLSVVAHEIGHTFGLPHSSGPYGDTYDNPYDVMSADRYPCYAHDLRDTTYGCIPQQTIGYHKQLLGWLAADDIVTVGPGETVVELDILSADDAGRPRLVVVPVVGGDGQAYMFEARALEGYDAGVPAAGVVVHFTRRMGEFVATLMDGDNNGDTFDDGAHWQVGETFTAPYDGITVTISAKTATGYRLLINAQPPPPFTSCAAEKRMPHSECEALVALYQQTGGPQWSRRAGWLSSNNPCYWEGVICAGARDAETGGQVNHVVALYLGYNDLVGPIPPKLFHNTALQWLELAGNRLSGPLPDEMGGASSLIAVFLDNNALTGPVPPELGDLPSLVYLFLHNNQLSGSLPAELGQSASLEEISLGNNTFSGSIPPQWGDLAALRYLDLGNNQLSGPLPPKLGQLASLKEMRLGNNSFSGSIPPQWGDLAALRYLLLENNQLSGPIPPQWGDLAALRYLGLGNNQLSGPLPAELGQLAWLEEMRLGNNTFSGPIPPQWGDLAALRLLDLGNNQLSGPLPAELGQLASLEFLWLGNNAFSGPIPPQWENMVAMREMNLRDNQLSGPLPPDWWLLYELEFLDLGNNAFSGQLPPLWGNLDKLYHLGLSGNQLVGLLPAEWGRATQLEYLDLSQNPLVGTVPHAFQDITELRDLYLHGTGVCLPPDDAFQMWLSGVSVTSSDGLCATSLAGNYPDGAPGSVFAVRGIVFSPDALATVSVDGRLIGQVMTDGFGELFFLLDTAEAAEGRQYEVAVTIGAQRATLLLTLDDDLPTRTAPFGGLLLAIPPETPETPTPTPTPETPTPTPGPPPSEALFLGVVMR